MGPLSENPRVSIITPSFNQGKFLEVGLKGDAQGFLRRLSAQATVRYFEIARPSLHEIFLRIAKPEKETIA